MTRTNRILLQGIYVLDQQVVLYGPIGDDFNYRNSTYPIVVKLQPSQTQPYSFWVEYGPNEDFLVAYLQENILLKTSSGQY